MLFSARTAISLALAGVLTACSAPAPKAPAAGQLAANDFENLDGWLTDSPALATLTQDKAHSGRYSSRVSEGHDFSLGYNNTLARLSPQWPTRLTVGAWVLLTGEPTTAKLVTEIKSADANGTGLLWEGLDIGQKLKVLNKWHYIEQTITVPATAKPDSRLLVYLWRVDSRQPVYLDDLTISLAKP